MKKKEINEKYLIKMILEEMYVWNDDFEDGSERLVLFYDKDSVNKNKYHALICEGGFACVIDYENAITLEEYEKRKKPAPVSEKIKMADYGYFWNDDIKIKSFFWGKLKNIIDITTLGDINSMFSYENEQRDVFNNFSKTRPEWANHN